MRRRAMRGPRPRAPAAGPRGLGHRIMNRRAFIGTVAGAFLAAPLASEAQPAGRVPKIGYVSPGSPSFGAYASQRAFLEGLRDHGYLPGHDFIRELRSTEGRSERLFY